MIIKAFEERPALSGFVALVGAILIFYVSSVELSSLSGDWGSWKALTYHFFAFFFFGAFVMISLVQGKKKRRFFVAGVLAGCYAIFDEIHQYFVPGRAFSVYDILTDWLGIFYALLIYMLLLELRRRKG